MNIYSRVEMIPSEFKDDVSDDTLYPVAQANGSDIICYAVSAEIAAYLVELLNKEREHAC
jgi:hypothetical protein